HVPRDLRDLHSFPTRRSSDLFTVWWDRTIPPGRVFDEVIQEAIEAARCMVVLWSGQSVKSNWVKTEAAEGAARHRLVPVLVENRSEEHTSELQSRENLVCRLL